MNLVSNRYFCFLLYRSSPDYNLLLHSVFDSNMHNFSINQYIWKTFYEVRFLKQGKFEALVFQLIFKANSSQIFSANHQAEIRRLAILVMGLIIAFLICWTPVELIALIHFTGKAGMLCENACRTAKNVRNGFLTTLTKT